MGNKLNFDKIRFATIMLQTFITAYSHGKDVTEVYARLRERVNTNIETEKDERKRETLDECRKILEKCRDFFKDVSIKKSVDNEISAFRDEVNATLGRNPSDAEIAKRLLFTFSDEFWGDGKRKYDMSQLATKNTISTKITSQGTVEKDVQYLTYEEEQKILKKLNNSENESIPEPPCAHLQDKLGNPITVTYMGCLRYHDGTSYKSISKYNIAKTKNGIERKPREIYSNLNINRLKTDPEFRDIVVSELLSEYNLEHSNADGYIGEITTPEIPSLESGYEREDSGFDRYQINKKFALEYEGEIIEAIRAYKEKLVKKHSQNLEETVKFEAPNKGEEPDL